MDGRRFALVALVAVLGAACAGGGSDEDSKRRPSGPACIPPDVPTVSLANNVQPIFDASCALGGCHAGAPPLPGDLDLSAGASRRDLVRVASFQMPARDRVAPGDPDESYLVRKIENAADIFGEQMPLGCPGTPQGGAVCLTNNQILAIRTWVSECALDN